ncbi:hypothetical protein COLSTE_01163 [Collinsella stercoris DSM 13279]|uniref:Uncharacterized protein n=1 Tax=Collinsella stercoris DSM 13279 TaxID=445975 RepID=B6GAR3_9ACTN|nr:hypothetical protein COLSTE_01163 [Collinsella stercoris DSM 13279]
MHMKQEFGIGPKEVTPRTSLIILRCEKNILALKKIRRAVCFSRQARKREGKAYLPLPPVGAYTVWTQGNRTLRHMGTAVEKTYSARGVTYRTARLR